MSNEHAQTLNRLFEDGYLIYVDNEEVAMIETPEEQGEVSEGYHLVVSMYDNGPYRLEDYLLSDIRVYARVDWVGILEIEDRAIGGLQKDQSPLPCLQDWNQDLDNAYDEAGD